MPASSKLAPLAVLLGTAACAAQAPCPATVPALNAAPLPAPTASAAPTSAPVANVERKKVAVLPFQDEELFRDERRSLRQKLAAELAKRLPGHDIVPLTEVDAKLRPVSKGGARCAFDGAPAARRANAEGWLTTDLVHVMGFKDHPEELWVQLSSSQNVETTLTSPWDPKLARIARYDSSFSVLKPLPDGGGLLGGLAGTFAPKGEITVGSLTLCQRHGFRDCVPETRAFTDRAEELGACFAGADDERRYVLWEGAGRCELENVDDVSGPDGRREACLCGALAKSAGASASKGRWRLALHYEAKDLLGKARPEIRVVDASTNLHAEDDWHSMQREEKGKRTYSSVRRLSVDNVDSVRPALARCGFAAGSSFLAELTLNEAGMPGKARITSGAKSKRESVCAEKALASGAFTCTSDGKPAQVRLAVSWPE